MNFTSSKVIGYAFSTDAGISKSAAKFAILLVDTDPSMAFSPLPIITQLYTLEMPLRVINPAEASLFTNVQLIKFAGLAQ
ncbi:unknown [Tannerella sp. CAG:118]|nr:unknown [Tannerella sp. CAG:118]